MSELEGLLRLGAAEAEALIDWLGREGVAYPWGDDPSPYRVWVSEVMLQQTVVTAAVGHFTRWMGLFPDAAALSRAEEQEVLKAWEGLGYYSRARNLRKGALYLTAHHRGELPADYEELIRVPGIGDYTARAILSLAYGQPLPVLDANVRRIAQRLTARAEWGRGEDKELLALLAERIPRERPGAFNAALMQLGQLVCRSGSPHCPACPLGSSCLARERGLQGEIPRKKARSVKEKETVLFLIRSGRRVLLLRRSKGIGAGLWFIPGVEKGEAPALSRALAPVLQEAGRLPRATHLYTCWKDALFTELYETRRPEEAEHPAFLTTPEDRMAWVPLEELEDYPSPSVYRKILQRYLDSLTEE